MPLRVAGTALVKWLGGGTVLALLLGGAAYLYHDWQTGRLQAAKDQAEAELAAVRFNRDQWRIAAETWERQAERLQADRDAAREAQHALRTALQDLDADDAALRQRIQGTPPEDDGPVAPVLRETLEALE